MSTRHSIWLGESQGKSVHIYWELAEREIGDGGNDANSDLHCCRRGKCGPRSCGSTAERNWDAAPDGPCTELGRGNRSSPLNLTYV
jgi:hypothetical protein